MAVKKDMKTRGVFVGRDFAEGEGNSGTDPNLGLFDKGEEEEKGVWGLKFPEKELQNYGVFIV